MKTMRNTDPVHVTYVVLILSVEWIDFNHSLRHLAPLCLLQNHAMAAMPLCQCLHRGEGLSVKEAFAKVSTYDLDLAGHLASSGR